MALQAVRGLDKAQMSGDIAVIILTFNEEQNIAQALRSVSGWTNENIHSRFSKHRIGRLDIACRYGCHIAVNKFVNYAKQRNYALDHLPIRSEWVLFLDADEWLPDALKREISTLARIRPKKMDSISTGS